MATFEDSMKGTVESILVDHKNRSDSIQSVRQDVARCLDSARAFISQFSRDFKGRAAEARAELKAVTKARVDNTARLRGDIRKACQLSREQVSEMLGTTRQSRAAHLEVTMRTNSTQRKEIAADLKKAAEAWRKVMVG
jgi:hypothetical protein